MVWAALGLLFVGFCAVARHTYSVDGREVESGVNLERLHRLNHALLKELAKGPGLCSMRIVVKLETEIETVKAGLKFEEGYLVSR